MLDRAPLAKVLVPTDFSESAEHALARALVLPISPQGRIHVVQVVPAGQAASASARLAEYVTRTRPTVERAVAVTSQVLEGDPPTEIIRCSRRIGAELIVLGKGLPIHETRLVGTTAQRVIRKGDVPVLVVKRPPEHRYRRPLVATDLTDASRRLIDIVARVLDPRDLTIDIVHAAHVPFVGFVAPTAAGQERSRYRRGVEHEVHERLDRLLASYHDAGIRWRPHVLEGEARAVIVREAARCESDLVALGTHGRSGISHLVLGSVAEGVLGNVASDVLVANPMRHTLEV